ncbi:tetratricopeptide repeat protein [Ichthyenterobacterium magnum]|uniref:Uncharacterized protein n=1 Tax=Ichthyenterobacterium magnum TaxID=1230530 RepID=A0A420DVX9_9FLAO|nr:hypothetical protein [Ichthyenterobacterium magnum]RKE98388.1 hypothetical protein BXY80_0472 [Ichthyenterobacterium magnum]
MKTRITLILAALFFVTNISFAQQDEECMNNLTIFTDAVKSKKYDDAYEPWMAVRKKCPKFNYAIYAYGEKILKHKIKNSNGAEKVDFINDLMNVWDEGTQYFSSKYKLGEVLSDKGLLMYDNQKELGLTDKQVYEAFHKAYTDDLKNFTSAKGLYVYFTKVVDMFKAGQAPIQDVFNKYDDVSDKLEDETKNFTQKLNKLVAKEDAEQTLTKKEVKYKKYYQDNLVAYDKISGSIDTYLGQLANCENLIPLYKKDFPTYKNDAVWLKRAVSRMYNKECTDDPLYIELVKAYDATAPSADTKYFVATILFKQGKDKEAGDYLKQSYELESDTFKKARLAERIGNSFKSKGSYGQARIYYNNALKLNPSNGRPHIKIAEMYAKSANNCGSTTFNKRAVYWLAAQEARKAGRVDASLKSTSSKAAAAYEGRAPSKSEIFTAGNAGQTIKIGCWIQRSVKVPNI